MGPVTHDIYLIGVVIVILLTIPANAVPIFYALKFPWRQFDEGKAVMISTIGLALLVDLALVFRVVPLPLWSRVVIADIVYTVILAGSTYKLVVLIRNWRRSRREAVGK